MRSPERPVPDPERCSRHIFGHRKGGWHGQRGQETPEKDREAQVQETVEAHKTSATEQVRSKPHEGPRSFRGTCPSLGPDQTFGEGWCSNTVQPAVSGALVYRAGGPRAEERRQIGKSCVTGAMEPRTSGSGSVKCFGRLSVRTFGGVHRRDSRGWTSSIWSCRPRTAHLCVPRMVQGCGGSRE